MTAVPPETQTANYGWIKPYPTGSTSTWGATINTDLDAIDSQVKTNANAFTIGVTNGSDAVAGNIGEVIASNVTAPVSLAVTNTTYNVASVALTAGDWEVSGEVWIAVGTGGASLALGGINSVSATFPLASGLNTSRTQQVGTLTASSNQILPLRPCRASIGTPTTYYLVASAAFPSGAVTATGSILARRVR